MKKATFCLYITLFAVMLLGCNPKAKYKYMNELSQITEIQIVEVTDYITGDEGFTVPELTTICTIDDTDAVINDLAGVTCYLHYTDPLGVNIGSIGFKLLYNNGDYELICASGQAKYLSGERYNNYAGYRSFDDDEFADLIEKYTNLYGES